MFTLIKTSLDFLYKEFNNINKDYKFIIEIFRLIIFCHKINFVFLEYFILLFDNMNCNTQLYLINLFVKIVNL